jgi:hypothetical protein
MPLQEWINEVPNDGLIRYRMMFNKEVVFVTSPKALSEVLVQKNYDFSKPYKLRQGLGRILGIGLIIAEGEEHKVCTVSRISTTNNRRLRYLKETAKKFDARVFAPTRQGPLSDLLGEICIVGGGARGEYQADWTI